MARLGSPGIAERVAADEEAAFDRTKIRVFIVETERESPIVSIP